MNRAKPEKGKCCIVREGLPTERGLIYRKNEKGAMGGPPGQKNLCPGECGLQTWVGEMGTMAAQTLKSWTGAGSMGKHSYSERGQY